MPCMLITGNHSKVGDRNENENTGDDGGNNGSTENRGGDEGSHNKNGFGGSSDTVWSETYKTSAKVI